MPMFSNNVRDGSPGSSIQQRGSRRGANPRSIVEDQYDAVAAIIDSVGFSANSQVPEHLKALCQRDGELTASLFEFVSATASGFRNLDRNLKQLCLQSVLVLMVRYSESQPHGRVDALKGFIRNLASRSLQWNSFAKQNLIPLFPYLSDETQKFLGGENVVGSEAFKALFKLGECGFRVGGYETEVRSKERLVNVRDHDVTVLMQSDMRLTPNSRGQYVEGNPSLLWQRWNQEMNTRWHISQLADEIRNNESVRNLALQSRERGNGILSAYKELLEYYDFHYLHFETQQTALSSLIDPDRNDGRTINQARAALVSHYKRLGGQAREEFNNRRR